MPNRYEREIEEILNRMEESDPHKGSGNRIRPFRRPKPPRPRGLPAPQIALVEFLFLLAIVLILVASGLAFYDGEPTLISGVIALAGVILFVVALAAGWRDRFRPSSPPQWRGYAVDDDRPRRGPFSALSARFRIWRLRRQYRRSRATRDELDD